VQDLVLSDMDLISAIEKLKDDIGPFAAEEKHPDSVKLSGQVHVPLTSIDSDVLFQVTQQGKVQARHFVRSFCEVVLEDWSVLVQLLDILLQREDMYDARRLQWRLWTVAALLRPAELFHLAGLRCCDILLSINSVLLHSRTEPVQMLRAVQGAAGSDRKQHGLRLSVLRFSGATDTATSVAAMRRSLIVWQHEIRVSLTTFAPV
jgi:hypothetical protein